MLVFCKRKASLLEIQLIKLRTSLSSCTTSLSRFALKNLLFFTVFFLLLSQLKWISEDQIIFLPVSHFFVFLKFFILLVPCWTLIVFNHFQALFLLTTYNFKRILKLSVPFRFSSSLSFCGLSSKIFAAVLRR